MRVKLFSVIAAVAALAVSAYELPGQAAGGEQGPSQTQGQSAGSGRGQGQGSGQGQRGRGMGGFPGGGRGVLGAVTEATGEHYTIKTDSGDTYTVHFSVNTRILKQPAGQGYGRRGTGGGAAETESGVERQPPQPIKPSEIKVGDFITAAGEMDTAAKSIGAVFIVQVDPERAKQMREMQANYGKTWLAGRITGIQDTTITIDGIADHTSHAIQVDENTSFRRRRDAITLGDIQAGEQVRAEGAVKGGVFVATTVVALPAQNREEGDPNPAGPTKPQ